jgi:hypothetical protein
MGVNGGFMKDESDSYSGLIHWIAKLTRKIASGKIVPLYQGEDLPPPVADRVKDARAIWMVVLNGSRFDIDAIFGKSKARRMILTRPAHNKKRIMFPCPVHANLDREAQADVIRRSKLAQRRDVGVKWVDHEIPESMIIINPPTGDNPNLDNGMAVVDLSLPHLDTAARAKFEITQKHQSAIFSDLVKSFSITWGKAHDPSYENKKDPDVKPMPVLKRKFVP